MSSITDSTMSLNVMTVTLNMGEFYCARNGESNAANSNVVHLN